MVKKLKASKKVMLISMVLVLVVLPILGGETLAQPKPEGTLNVAAAAIGEEGFLPDMGDASQVRIWGVVYEYPFYRNAKTMEMIPGLAKRFEYSKDYMTLTLYMKEGIPWQDAQKWGEVTAEDVKYSYERYRREGSTCGQKGDFESVTNIEVKDPHTLVLHLKAPDPELASRLFAMANAGSAPILCKKYIETVGEEKARWEPIGSGPWRLVEHQTGQYLKFEAVEKHWRVVPEFKYLIEHIVPEGSTRLAMLKTGKIDITPVTALQADSLKDEQGIKMLNWGCGYNLSFCFGGMVGPKDPRYKAGYHWTDPWKDVKVREALNIAIDRQAIIKSIYKGGAQAMPIPWILTGWEKLPPLPYDPKKAKQLLAEAGYPNGFSLKLISVGDWAPSLEIPELAEIIAAYWKDIGVKAEIVMMDKEKLSNIGRKAENKGIIYPDKETSKRSYSGRFYDKFWLDSEPPIFLSDEQLDLVAKYEKEPNLGKRAAALEAILNYQYKEIVAIPLVFAVQRFAYRDSTVGDWPPGHTDKIDYFEYVRHAKPLNTYRLFTP